MTKSNDRFAEEICAKIEGSVREMEMKSSWTKDVQAKLLKETIATLRDEVLALNDWMAEHPELGSQEFESSRRIVELLRRGGKGKQSGEAYRCR